MSLDGSGDMSHGRTSALHDHLDHSIIVFKNEKGRSLAGAVARFQEKRLCCLRTSCPRRLRLFGSGVAQTDFPVPEAPTRRLPSPRK